MAKTATTETRRKRQRLNDLSGKEWLTHTKTAVLNSNDRVSLVDAATALSSGALLSQAPRRCDLKKNHPATFSEKDISRLVRLFTRAKGVVLDPFLGSGSTAIACMAENRHCIGFELYEQWHRQAEARIEAMLATAKTLNRPDVRCCDALSGLGELKDESVDFVVTSPPYWNILKKKDHKAKQERVGNGLATDYGNHPQDLSSITEYNDFLDAFSAHMAEYHRVLKRKAYASIIVSDFRHGQQYYLFHAHVAERMEQAGFTIQGLIVLVQDNKKLYPYGYPSTFVPNISNQYIVVARRLK